MAVHDNAVNHVAALAQMTADESGVMHGGVVEIEHGRLEREVAHTSSVHIAEESRVVLRRQFQACYGMPVAVEISAESLPVLSYRHKLSLARHVDVGHKPGV